MILDAFNLEKSDCIDGYVQLTMAQRIKQWLTR